MSENYKIISKFIKDISGETPNIETYLYVKDFISKYQLNIEINSKPLKAQIIEVNTLLKFHDTSESKKKSHFEMTYTSVIKLNEEIKDKKILQKIILCDVQKEIYPELEKALLNLLHTSGYPNIKFEKKVDFDIYVFHLYQALVHHLHKEHIFYRIVHSFNLHPHLIKFFIILLKNGAGKGDRTLDLLVGNETLYH